MGGLEAAGAFGSSGLQVIVGCEGFQSFCHGAGSRLSCGRDPTNLWPYTPSPHIGALMIRTEFLVHTIVY